MANQFKTFVSGDVLTAAQVNSYLMKQAVIVCDSSSDYPTSPNEGMAVWDKAADALKIYTTATTGFQPPWNMAWGLVPATAGGSGGYGHATVTSATTGVTTTATAVTNLYVSWSAVQNRRYRITVVGHVLSTIAGDTMRVLLYDNTTIASGNIVTSIDVVNSSTTNATVANLIYSETAASTATLTRQVAIVRGGGTGTVQFFAESVSPFRSGRIVVEDIGPAGAPA